MAGKKPGPDPVDPKDRRSKKIQVMVIPHEAELIDSVLKEGESMSDFGRDAMLARAKSRKRKR